jgi:hypothetical protein
MPSQRKISSLQTALTFVKTFKSAVTDLSIGFSVDKKGTENK